MKGLFAYGLFKASRTSQEEADKKYKNAPNPNDGTNDPNNPMELEDVEEANEGNAAVSDPNDALGYQAPINWNPGWLRPQQGSNIPGYSFEMQPEVRQPRNNYEKTLQHVYEEPANTSLGLGGGTGYYDNNMFFNPVSGKYEKNLNTRSDMMPNAHQKNRHYQMAQKPHLQFDKATGKYFNPSNGAPNSPSYSGLVPGSVNDSQGNPVSVQKAYVKNPVFTRAVENYNTRNDPNSVLGKSINDRMLKLTDPGKTRPSSTPAMQTQKAMRPSTP